MTMTKADIVERIYEKVGFSKKEATEVVESIFEMVNRRLERGEKVKISGFGNFVVNEKRPRDDATTVDLHAFPRSLSG